MSIVPYGADTRSPEGPGDSGCTSTTRFAVRSQSFNRTNPPCTQYYRHWKVESARGLPESGTENDEGSPASSTSVPTATSPAPTTSDEKPHP